MPTKKSNFSRYVIPSPIHPVGECCICVPVPDSPEYIAQFMGAIWRMGIQSHYERDAAHSGAIVAAKWRAIWLEVQNQMTCCGPSELDRIIQIDIRNNSINILMQHIRQLWIDADFDIDVAFYGVPDKFDSDEDDVGDEVDDRTRALCLAVESWVDGLFNQGMEFLEGAVTDVVPVAAGAVVLPSIPTYIVAGAGIVMLFAGAQAYAEMLSAVYRQYITCTMIQNLEGEDTTSRVAWNAALDTFTDPRPQPETWAQDLARDAIEEWARSQLNNLDNYLAFISNLDAANSIASTLSDSDCGCTGWQHLFDFSIDEQGWVNRAADNRDAGVYSPGVGWLSEWVGDGWGDVNAERLYIEITGFDDTVVTGIHVYYTVTGVDNAQNATIEAKLDDVRVDLDINNLWTIPSVFVHRSEFIGTIDEVEQSIVNWVAVGTSLLKITAIVMTGQGNDPFE